MEWINLLLAAVLGAIIRYVPGLMQRWEQMPPFRKHAVALPVLIILCVGVFGLNCAGWADLGFSCDLEGFLELLSYFLSAYFGAFALPPASSAVISGVRSLFSASKK